MSLLRAWRLALLLVLLMSTGLPGAARAASPAADAPPLLLLDTQHPVLSLAGNSRFWVDDSGRRTLDEVVAAGDSLPWKVRTEGMQHNIDHKALWVQFDAQVQGASRWFVEIASSGVDRAQFFYQEPSTGRWVTLEAGDTRPVSQWPLPGRVPTFPLALEPGKTVHYWMRFEHARVDFGVPARIYDEAHLFASREREQFMLGAYFGLAVLITVVAAANALAYRDRTFGSYAIYVGMLGLSQAAYLGVGAQHLWDPWLGWNALSTFLLPGLSSAVGLWFVRTVTEPARYSRALDLAVWSLMAAQLSAVALDTYLESRATFALVLLLTIVILVVIGLLIGIVWAKGDDPEIRVIALGFLPVMVLAAFPIARGLNLIPNSVLTRYGVSIGAVLEMPILFYALSLRGSRRREAAVRAAALAHTDALTGLAHTRSLLQRLEAALARARSLKHPCALLAVNLANRDQLQAEFGAESVEKALVVTASHLRHAASDIDLPARVGDHVFAVLLEGPTHAGTVLSRAQHVIASGLRQAEGLPPGMTLKYHVAAAMLPERDLGAQASLQWVIEAVQGIPADARKMIRPLNF
jgi:diguanylate cyclase (GGDEF)-like protein